MAGKKYIYIVNVTRQLSIDMINYFHSKGDEVHLMTGVLEVNYAPLHPGVKVTYLIKYNNTSSFKRLFTWIVFSIQSFFLVLFTSRRKELILITSPPFSIFLGVFFKWVRSQKYHLILWDLYPDALINFKVLSEKSFIIRRWKKMNRKCFDSAENIFTLGIHLSEAIGKYTNKKPVIIQNWVNADFIKPVPRSENPFAIKYNLENKLVVMYSGNLGITHDIESIVLTAELLKNEPDIHFVIVGDGAKKAKIDQMVSDKKLNNMLLLPYQEKEVLPYSLSAADIGIVTLGEGAESISVPSKTYYTFAAGSAIIALASLDSELALLIEKYKCGKIFDDQNCRKIADHILFLSANPEALKKLKENSRKAAYDFTPANAGLYYQAISKAE